MLARSLFLFLIVISAARAAQSACPERMSKFYGQVKTVVAEKPEYRWLVGYFLLESEAKGCRARDFKITDQDRKSNIAESAKGLDSCFERDDRSFARCGAAMDLFRKKGFLSQADYDRLREKEKRFQKDLFEKQKQAREQRNGPLRAACGPARDFRSLVPKDFNQGEFGWCYAYSASLLVASKLGKPVSPTDLALGNLRNKMMGLETGADGFDGGYIDSAIHNADREGGFCPADTQPTADFAKSDCGKEYARKYGTLTKMLSPSLNEMKKSRTCPIGLSLAKEIGLPELGFLKHGKSYDERLIRESLKNKCDCDGKRIRLPQGIKTCTFEGGQTVSGRQSDFMVDTTHELLNHNEVVSIAVEAEKGPNGESQFHALTVVGRRFDEESGECRFIIQNSWGASCLDSLDPKMREQIRPQPTIDEEAGGDSCAADGSFEMTPDDLNEHLRQLNYLGRSCDLVDRYPNWERKSDSPLPAEEARAKGNKPAKTSKR